MDAYRPKSHGGTGRLPLTSAFRHTTALILVLIALGCVSASERPRTQGAGTRPAVAGRTKPHVVVAPNRLDAGQAVAELQAERDRFWLNAKKQVDKSVLELVAQHRAELQRGLRYDKLMRGNPTRKQIALTFDDGPHPDCTPKLLSILAKYNVKVTFFLVGEMAEKYPSLVRAEVAAGHSIGNHTYHHVSLIKIPEEDVATEIKSCGEVLGGITGKAPRWFRPPGGDYNPQVAEVSEALGYTMVLWTDDPGDYASPGRRIVLSRTLGDVDNGGILLLHDGVQQTLDVLPQIIETLQKRGYQFVTVDAMMAAGR